MVALFGRKKKEKAPELPTFQASPNLPQPNFGLSTLPGPGPAPPAPAPNQSTAPTPSPMPKPAMSSPTALPPPPNAPVSQNPIPNAPVVDGPQTGDMRLSTASPGPRPLSSPAPDMGHLPVSIPSRPASMPEPPTPPVPPEAPGHMTLLTEDIEKLVDSNIAKRWEKLQQSIDKLEDWKRDTEKKVIELQQTLEKVEKKMSDSQNAIVGKVSDYDKSIKDVNVELKALSKVFEKVLPTFTENVKNLQDSVKKIKSKK